jgi:Phytanoyl-CoA dioxygenase (PhyH)
MLKKVARYIRLIKQGITDYRWLLFYIQRMDYHPQHRQFISSAIARFLPKSLDNEVHIENMKQAQNLQKEGFVVLDGFMNKSQLDEMRAYINTKLCFDPYRPEKDGFNDPEQAHKSCIHAYYPEQDIVCAPYLLGLVNDPKILNIIENIYGAKPTISLIHMWWLLHSFDVEANSHDIYVNNPQEFHRDVDDWSEIKLFIYLTDVDEGSGAHTFIKTSQTWLLPPKTRAIDFDNPAFPCAENLVTLTGLAGFAWLENTYGLHRATIPINQHRLILSVTYTLFPLPHAPKKPLYSGQKRFDPYVNRVYLQYS